MFIYRCASATELLMICESLALSRRGIHWVFRGQGSCEWTLRPSLLRALPRACDPVKYEEALIAQMRAVLIQRTLLPSRLIERDDLLLALAQHYGSPTRLLDWTLDPFVALYFAVSGALRGEASHGYCSVFAMGDIYYRVGSASRIATMLDVPRAANPNLVAQRGRLLLIDWEAKDLWDERVAKHSTIYPPDALSALIDSRFWRLDLSVGDLEEALRHLAERGVDATMLFPTELGLVRHASDHALSLSDQVTALCDAALGGNIRGPDGVSE